MSDKTEINIDDYMKVLDKKIQDEDKKNQVTDDSKLLHTGKHARLLDFTLVISLALFGSAIIGTAFDVSAKNKSTQNIESMLQEIHTYYYKPASTMKTGYDFMKPLPELAFDNYTVVPSYEKTQQNCKGDNEVDFTGLKPAISI